MAEVLPFDRKSFYSQVQSTRVYLESDKVQTGIPKRNEQGQQFCSKSDSLFDLALKHSKLLKQGQACDPTLPNPA